LQAYRVPITFALDARIGLSVEARHFADGIGFNVVAYLPGSDPLLKGECVVLGAHFDGCGRHLGILFPGADDNASGSAMVMEIARAFALSGIRPKRTLAFVLFGGEEMGLLGSTYYAAHVPAPLKNIDAMFNFDMEGEGARAFTQFSQEPAALKEAMEKADGYDPIIAGSRPLKEVGVRSSDFAPFFLQGIPCAAFYSDGPHLHYHAAGDTIFRINPDIMGAISRLAFLSAWFWADRS
jgi:Zn-dependent M28 family amino/carboxypeptidase